MGRRFKWHMFFTSFLPLWVSIIICDIWNLVEDSCMTLISLNEDPTVFQNTSELIKDFLLEHIIEVGSVVILVACKSRPAVSWAASWRTSSERS